MNRRFKVKCFFSQTSTFTQLSTHSVDIYLFLAMAEPGPSNPVVFFDIALAGKHPLHIIKSIRGSLRLVTRIKTRRTRGAAGLVDSFPQ